MEINTDIRVFFQFNYSMCGNENETDSFCSCGPVTRASAWYRLALPREVCPFSSIATADKRQTIIQILQN
jgi:hypothetical protein